MSDEAELMSRCRRGEPAAFTALFREFRDPAYRYCLGMVGRPEDARDIVQEAYLAALHGIRRLDPERGFAGWFYGILRHLCFATLKGRRCEVPAEQLEWEPSPEKGPEAQAHEDERRRALAACLAELTATQREVLVLRELEGLAYREIAERLEVPMGTVMSRLYEARKALARVAAKHPALNEEARS
jgi:RNA polymerase sigma-70 factor (ECF subfamily)